MITVGDVLSHKNERLITERLSKIRQEDPASLFGSGFVHYVDTNGRDQWSFEHEAGITMDISSRVDPASFDLIVWLFDGGHVIADYPGFSIVGLVRVIQKNVASWLRLAQEATKPGSVDMQGITIDAINYDSWKHEHKQVAEYQDQIYLRQEAKREASTQKDGDS